MTKRRSSLILFDGRKTAAAYTRICRNLCEIAISKALPEVKDASRVYLSKKIARRCKDNAPISNVSTLIQMQEKQDDTAIMPLHTTMIVASKMGPEATMQPISQLIRLKILDVVNQDSNAIFAFDSNAQLSPVSCRWEVRCSSSLLLCKY